MSEKPKISLITIFHNEKDFIPLIKENLNSFDYPKEQLELIIVDDGDENLMSEFCSDERILYLHLSKEERKEFLDKITFKNDPQGIKEKYQHKINHLPNGFKRDYGVGMASSDYIFHLDYDTAYHPKTLNRKLNYLQRVKVGCIFCDSLLCMDTSSKDKEMYKTKSQFKIYEGTLFHTKEYWTKGGFEWSDTEYEGRIFHSKGEDRLHDNYFDAVKLLTIANYRNYQPVKLDMKKSTFDIKIHDLAKEITLKEYNPIKETIQDLFHDSEINILGMNSEYIHSFKEDKWSITDHTGKIKQTKIAKELLSYDKDFNILIYGHKQPIWDVFEKVRFDVILLETYKNTEQMHSIIQGCKKYEYIYKNGIFINHDFIKPEKDEELEESKEVEENKD